MPCMLGAGVCLCRCIHAARCMGACRRGGRRWRWCSWAQVQPCPPSTAMSPASTSTVSSEVACYWIVGRAAWASSRAALAWRGSGRWCAAWPVSGSHTFMQTTMQAYPGLYLVYQPNHKPCQSKLSCSLCKRDCVPCSELDVDCRRPKALLPFLTDVDFHQHCTAEAMQRLVPRHVANSFHQPC